MLRYDLKRQNILMNKQRDKPNKHSWQQTNRNKTYSTKMSSSEIWLEWHFVRFRQMPGNHICNLLKFKVMETRLVLRQLETPSRHRSTLTSPVSLTYLCLPAFSSPSSILLCVYTTWFFLWFAMVSSLDLVSFCCCRVHLISFVGIAETMSCLEETFFLSSSCLDLITIPPLTLHLNLIKKKDLL